MSAESFFEAMLVTQELCHTGTMVEFFTLVLDELENGLESEPRLALDAMMAKREQEIRDDRHEDSTRAKELAARDVLDAVTSARKWLDHLENYAKNYGSKR